MGMGASFVNCSGRGSELVEEVDRAIPVIYILFFALAGATLDPRLLIYLGALGVGYLGLRSLGKVLGTWAGAKLAGFPRFRMQLPRVRIVATGGSSHRHGSLGSRSRSRIGRSDYHRRFGSSHHL